MDAQEFRIRGKEMVDYVVDYLENIRERRVIPDKKPGFLQDEIPGEAPVAGESWASISADIERVIMPGVTHWQSPHMHAYFPALTSYPSMLGEMLTNAINCIGFTWASSPVCTELEMVVTNWLAKMMNLPEQFLHRKNGMGGGVLQTSTSECTLVSLLAARSRAIKKCKEISPDMEKGVINSKLVAYASDQAHSSIEKAALIGLVNIRYIPGDENLSMRGHRLLQQIKKDREEGLIPFWVCATLGTTGACAFDNLDEVGAVCEEESLWLHVDAAYAGSAFICPEYRIWMKGIERVDSFTFNPSKWLMVHFDCSCVCFVVVIDQHFQHWQIPLSKRFRSLKLWFVIRSFGIVGLQEHIRKGVRLAEKFESLVRADQRFEIPVQRNLGLVVFRLVGDNLMTETLWKRINARGKIHCVPTIFKSKYVIRFTVTSPRTTESDILKDWHEIEAVATEMLQADEELDVVPSKARVALADTKQHEHFGTSLLLSNSPSSPKIVNGSFVAIYQQSDVIMEYSKLIRLRQDAQDSPAMRRRIKGILMSGKQFSLDSRLDLFHGLEPESPDEYVLLEVSNENEENACATEGDIQRCTRSKSMDHHDKISIEEVDDEFEKKKICEKCGHATGNN